MPSVIILKTFLFIENTSHTHTILVNIGADFAVTISPSISATSGWNRPDFFPLFPQQKEKCLSHIVAFMNCFILYFLSLSPELWWPFTFFNVPQSEFSFIEFVWVTIHWTLIRGCQNLWALSFEQMQLVQLCLCAVATHSFISESWITDVHQWSNKCWFWARKKFKILLNIER